MIILQDSARLFAVSVTLKTSLAYSSSLENPHIRYVIYREGSHLSPDASERAPLLHPIGYSSAELIDSTTLYKLTPQQHTVSLIVVKHMLIVCV